MVPLINYGDIIADEHCLLYGATLLGMMEDEYHQHLCVMSETLGVEARFAGEAGNIHPKPAGSIDSLWEPT